MKTLTIKVSIVLNTTTSKVFNTITDSKEITKWSGQRGVVQSIIGGKFEMFDSWVKGIVLGFEREKLLAVTWKPQDWSKDAMPSIVTFKFTKVKDRSKISITHTGFPNPKEAQSHKDGWKQFVFEPLKSYLSIKQNIKQQI